MWHDQAYLWQRSVQKAVCVTVCVAGAMWISAGVEVRAADLAVAPVSDIKALEAAVRAEDFWEQINLQGRHEFLDVTIRQVFQLAGRLEKPADQIRAWKVLADLRGHTRYHSANTWDGRHYVAVRRAMEYLEAHLDDATVQAFAPAQGFSHLAVARDAQDKLWILIEDTGPGATNRGGLNIECDLATGKVLSVKHWGKKAAS